jgi:DNA-binding FrmR family transcriptional regulator
VTRAFVVVNPAAGGGRTGRLWPRLSEAPTRVDLTARAGARILPPGGMDVINDETKGKALGRLRRIEGQVQGLQRMIDGEAYCVDILLQISAVQGALEQVEKLLLGRHIESCVADALRTGSKGERQQKIDELIEVFARFRGK